MKRLSLILLFVFGCLAVFAQKENLDGTWIPVKQELGGDAFPKETFESQKLVITGDQYIFHAESADKGKISYGNGKMTITGQEGPNANKTITSIYKLQDGMLTICYNLGGADAPKSFETKGEPLYFLAVFKKE